MFGELPDKVDLPKDILGKALRLFTFAKLYPLKIAIFCVFWYTIIRRKEKNIKKNQEIQKDKKVGGDKMSIKNIYEAYAEYTNKIDYTLYNNFENIITEEIEEKYNKIMEEIK